MEVVNSNEMQWSDPGGRLRDGGVEFKTLFRGDDFGPESYWFTLTQVRERYRAPRHRHNFDQVRIQLSGDFGFGEGRVQRAGSVGYFTEGTYYTQTADGHSTQVLLQTSNASRNPFIGARLRDGVEELRKSGEFKGGLYHRETDGVATKKDAYEAVWEHLIGRPIEYPEPRYDQPVFMEPERFAWRDVPGEPGVRRKKLGSFTERELEMGMLAIDAGARHRHDGARDGLRLLYATTGSGTVGELAWSAGCGVRLTADESCELAAAEPAEFYYIVMPR